MISRNIIIPLLTFALVSVPTVALSKKSNKAKQIAPLTQEQRAIHALNRLTFGPRPGDLNHVLEVGVDKWIDQQLHPESIDDSALNARARSWISKSRRMRSQSTYCNHLSRSLLKSNASYRYLASPPNDLFDFRAVVIDYELKSDITKSALTKPIQLEDSVRLAEMALKRIEREE